MEFLGLEGDCLLLLVFPHRGHCPPRGRGKRMGEELERDGRQDPPCPPLWGEVRPQCISGHCLDQKGQCLGVQRWP